MKHKGHVNLYDVCYENGIGDTRHAHTPHSVTHPLRHVVPGATKAYEVNFHLALLFPDPSIDLYLIQNQHSITYSVLDSITFFHGLSYNIDKTAPFRDLD